MTRVLLIGPVPPYRGGIAQYTYHLLGAIGASDDLLTISYSRQYPAFMYPGGSDKDPTSVASVPDVEYTIDAANPLSWPRVGRRIREFGPDLIVVQWWHVYWAPFSFWIRRLANRIGARIVMICHNVDDHEKAGWKGAIRNAALSGYAEFLVHSSDHAQTLSKFYPHADVRMHPIPAYQSFPSPDAKLPRRAKTELLFFGLIRPYKGLDILLNSLVMLREHDFFLTVAGESWDGIESYQRIIQEGQIAAKVELNNGYVSDQEAANLFARADAVVLPYRSASGSAVAAVAFNYRKPIVASRVGGLPDIVGDRTGLLVPPTTPEALATALKRVFEDDNWYDPMAIDATNERLTWASLASTLKGA